MTQWFRAVAAKAADLSSAPRGRRTAPISASCLSSLCTYTYRKKIMVFLFKIHKQKYYVDNMTNFYYHKLLSQFSVTELLFIYLFYYLKVDEMNEN